MLQIYMLTFFANMSWSKLDLQYTATDKYQQIFILFQSKYCDKNRSLCLALYHQDSQIVCHLLSSLLLFVAKLWILIWLSNIVLKFCHVSLFYFRERKKFPVFFSLTLTKRTMWGVIIFLHPSLWYFIILELIFAASLLRRQF